MGCVHENSGQNLPLMLVQLLEEEVKESKGAYSWAHMQVEGPHKVYTPCLGNHLVLSSCNICARHKMTCLLTKTAAINAYIS